MHVAILDNDSCALECIEAMVRACKPDVDISATMFPSALMRLCADGAHPIDVLLLDISLTGVSGLEFAPRIRQRSPRTRIVGMTAYEPKLLCHGLQEGILDALIDKNALRDRLPEIMRQSCPVPGKEAFRSAAAPEGRMSALSRKELMLVILSASGLDSGKVARHMGIKQSTVFSYRRNIKRKLGVDTWYDVLDLVKGNGHGQ